MAERELCDIQNEESAQLVREYQTGLRTLFIHKLYPIGEGPNPDVHDAGVGDLQYYEKKEEDERPK